MNARGITGYITVLFTLLYLLPLSLRPIISPDESRYGAIALEMLHSKDWWSLKLVGLSYYEKPPMGYWLTAVSMAVFGENAWGLRFAPALAALVTALATGAIAKRICALPHIGLIATSVQLTLLFPWVFGNVAILDGMFCAFITVCVAFFVYGATDPESRWRMFFFTLSGVAAAGAFLTKGFLGLAFPAIIAGGWLIWQKRWRDLLLYPFVPMISAVFISAPLIIEIHKHNPGFWDYFFWVEHVRRFTSPDDNQHPEPWWYFLPMLPVGALLWTLNIGKVWSGFRTSLFRGRGASLCAVWIALPLLLLSASSGKLPAYILPIFPAFSLLIAVSLVNYFSNAPKTSFVDQLGRWLLVIVALLFASFILTGHQWLFADPLWRDNSTWRFGLVALALLTWAALDHWAHQASAPTHRLLRMAISPAPLLMIAGLLLPDALIEKSKIGIETLRAQTPAIAQSHTVIVDANMATCVAYVTKKFDMTIIGPGGELENELNLPLEQARFITHEQVLAQVALAQKTGSVALVIMRDDLKAFHAPGAPTPQSEFIDGDVSVALFAQAK